MCVRTPKLRLGIGRGCMTKKEIPIKTTAKLSFLTELCLERHLLDSFSVIKKVKNHDKKESVSLFESLSSKGLE